MASLDGKSEILAPRNKDFSMDRSRFRVRCLTPGTRNPEIAQAGFHSPGDIENSGLRYDVFFIFLAKKELNLRIKRWMSAGLDQLLLKAGCNKSC